MTGRGSIIAVAMASASLVFCGQAAAQTATAADDADAASQKDVVVTGVFGAKAIEDAPISINVVTSQQLAEQSPVSTADLLKNIPGVFVNSALGEIRNVVFSRGISANSLDGAGGYYYVSLQEDGLPVDLVTVNNYGPDYYLRADVTLSRLEGLRGGTAAVTGPNAPGGIFNYISKNGRSNPGVEISARFGLQGDGRLPQYRLDAYAGGKLAENLYYSIGGFLRTDQGTHDAGYALNKGGQVKANVLYDYGSGSLTVTGKYLDDANTWNEFTPSFGGTRIAPGFSNVTSNLQPKSGAHCYPLIGGGRDCWDPTDLVRSRALALGVNWHQNLGGGFKIDNKLRFSRNQSIWNAGAVLSVVSLQDPIVNIIMGTAFLRPGTLNYYNGSALAASMTVNDNSPPPGVPPVFIPGYFTVNSNNLPNQGILANGDIAGNIGAYVGFANTQQSRSRQFEDQLTITGDVGNHHLAFGGFVGIARLTSDYSRSAGTGFMTLAPRPQMLTVTYTPAGETTAYQVTDPSGFGAMGQPVLTGYTGKQQQYALFLGDSWEITPRLTVEAGGRWEAIRYDIDNQTWISNPFALFPLGFGPGGVGGVDGNPLTLYDNGVSTRGPVLKTRRNFDYFNYSGAINYSVSDTLDTYIRYTNGKKAPDFGTIQGINSAAQIATIFPESQRIEQIEIGIKYRDHGLSLQAFPFYSLLSNVSTPTFFTYRNGPSIGQFYTPPPVAGQIKTFGVEIAADYALTHAFNLHGNLTLQQPKAKNFGSYTQGPAGDGTDDVLTIIPGGDADNNPKIIARGGFDWKPVDSIKFFGQATHLGKRAANAASAFYLPAFTTVDLGASWDVTHNITAQFNVNNVFNEVGIMSWSRTGFLASLDRQGLTAAQYNANAIYPVVPAQARAFIWTLTGKF